MFMLKYFLGLNMDLDLWLFSPVIELECLCGDPFPPGP